MINVIWTILRRSYNGHGERHSNLVGNVDGIEAPRLPKAKRFL